MECLITREYAARQRQFVRDTLGNCPGPEFHLCQYCFWWNLGECGNPKCTDKLTDCNQCVGQPTCNNMQCRRSFGMVLICFECTYAFKSPVWDVQCPLCKFWECWKLL